MRDSAQNVLIAQFCGYKPRKMWKYDYSPDRDHWSGSYRTKQAAEQSRLNQVNLWDEELWGEPCRIQPVEEYDDWDHIPCYVGNLDEMANAEALLSLDDYQRYSDILCMLVAPENDPPLWRRNYLSATSEQRAESLIRTLGLWIEENKSNETKNTI